MTDEDEALPNRLPRYAVLPGIGRCLILSYDGNGYFTVLDNRDTRRFVHRRRLTFLPEKGNDET